MLSPILVHLIASEVLAGGLLLGLIKLGMITRAQAIGATISLGGVANLLVIVLAYFIYGKDVRLRRGINENFLKEKGSTGFLFRRLKIYDIILILFMGGGIAILVNIFVNVINTFIQNQTYSTLIENVTYGKSIWMLVFWMGIVGPIAEELIFRWLVYLRMRDYMSMKWAVILSSVLFGLYHGNLMQFIYATIIGMMLAFFMEKTRSLLTPILFHMGANIASLLIGELLDVSFVTAESIMIAMIVISVVGIIRYGKTGSIR